MYAEHARNANMRNADACALRIVYKTTLIRVKQKNPTLVQAGLECVQKPLPLNLYIWQRQLVQDCDAKKTSEYLIEDTKAKCRHLKILTFAAAVYQTVDTVSHVGIFDPAL